MEECFSLIAQVQSAAKVTLSSFRMIYEYLLVITHLLQIRMVESGLKKYIPHMYSQQKNMLKLFEI